MIINTHEHFDHVMGNAAIQEATGATVWAKGGANVPKQTHNIEAGDEITLGTIRLKALHTPGHTSAHVCLLSDTAPAMLFSGDTLFNAAAGRSEEHTSELQSRPHLVCRLLLEKKKKTV